MKKGQTIRLRKDDFDVTEAGEYIYARAKRDTTIDECGRNSGYTLILSSIDDSTQKIKVIMLVREIMQIRLKEAKELVDGWPCIIGKYMFSDDTFYAIDKLKKYGAGFVLLDRNGYVDQ